jgi:hypothetical protein
MGHRQRQNGCGHHFIIYCRHCATDGGSDQNNTCSCPEHAWPVTTGSQSSKTGSIKAMATEQVAVQENIPSKTEKLFSIIVGTVLPVSILSLFFYLQYASDGFTEKLISGNKSS